MDAQTQTNLELLSEKGIIPPLVKSKGPRPANSYRAFRRNHVKASRALPAWRSYTAGYANHVAGIEARAVVANGAREAAAKALADNRFGIPQIASAAAVLNYYRDLPGRTTRPQARIIRELESHLRSNARKTV